VCSVQVTERKLSLSFCTRALLIAISCKTSRFIFIGWILNCANLSGDFFFQRRISKFVRLLCLWLSLLEEI